jgi:hypothetical protein
LGFKDRGIFGETRGVFGETRGVFGETRGVFGESRGHEYRLQLNSQNAIYKLLNL